MPSSELGAETAVFEQRNQVKVALLLLPAITTVFLIAIVMQLTDDNPRRPKPGVGLVLGGIAAEIAGVGGYVLLARRLRPSRLALHADGFVWRGEARRWDAVTAAKTMRIGAMESVSVWTGDETPLVLDSQIFDRKIVRGLAEALESRGLMKL